MSRHLERYALQGLLGQGFMIGNVEYTLPHQTLPPVERHKIFDTLKRIIDQRGRTSYRHISDASMSLVTERRFDVILDAMGYIRSHYPKPSLEVK